MGERRKVSVHTLRDMKRKGEKVAVLTAYDYQTAMIEDLAGVDAILVGDSLGMVVLGYESTLPVTLDQVIHHLQAVTRAKPRALVIGDLPFMSYQASAEDAVRSAGRLVKEGLAEAVKLEGGRRMEGVIRAILDADIPLMGHLGLTPQSVHRMGGYRVQGRDKEGAERLLEEAIFLQEEGCFAMVLEGIPAAVASEISQSLEIPTIGIGAGVGCDGQVLVANDMLGMRDDFSPKFLKQYAQLGQEMKRAFGAFIKDVKDGSFPDDDHSYS